MKYCFGVDIGGTTVKLGLFDAQNEVLLDKWEIKTRSQEKGKNILPDVAASIEEKLQEKAICKEDVSGIGAGVPAPVSKDGIVKASANVGWGYKDVKGELEELTGLPAAIGNDANVAALGEMWLGAGKGQKDMVMVTLGTGVGGGIIIDGKALTGSTGAGGEIGHICVNPKEEKPCGCGKKGCLEQYASARGIARLAKARLKKSDAPSKLRDFELEEITAKEVFDAVKEKDALALETAEEFGAYLGQALATIAVISNPKIFVIGGGVSKAGEVLLGFIEKYYQAAAFFANRDVEFLLASLGNDAGICGCAKLILDATNQ